MIGWRNKCKSIALFTFCSFTIISFGLMSLCFVLVTNATLSELIIYGWISATMFFCYGVMFSMAGGRTLYIDVSLEQIENQECFRSYFSLVWAVLMSDDFQPQRWIMINFSFGQFINTILTLQRLATLDEDLDPNKFPTSQSIYNAIVAIIIIKGIAIIIYLICHLIVMISDYQEYLKDVTYIVHIQGMFQAELAYKRMVARRSRLAAHLLCIFYLAKCVTFSALVNFEDDSMLTTLILIQSLSLLALFLKVASKLSTIYADSDHSLLTDTNSDYFAGWFVLIKSIIRSRELSYWRMIALILALIQSITALSMLPFYKISKYFDESSYGQQQYMLADSLILQLWLVTKVLEILMSIVHGVRERPLVFSFGNQSMHQVVMPLSMYDQHVQHGARMSLQPINQIPDTSLGECCVCLEQMGSHEKLKQLPCHKSHVFHYYCITKWLIHHNNCPLCQSPIFS